MSAKLDTPAFPDDDVVGTLNVGAEVRRTEALLKPGAHGGRIWIEDAAPGAIFCLRLPDA